MTTLCVNDAIAVAYALHDAGFTYSVHYNAMCKEANAGYGDLLSNGHWEYPLIVDQGTIFKIVPWNDVKSIIFRSYG